MLSQLICHYIDLQVTSLGNMWNLAQNGLKWMLYSTNLIEDIKTDKPKARTLSNVCQNADLINTNAIHCSAGTL